MLSVAAAEGVLILMFDTIVLALTLAKTIPRLRAVHGVSNLAIMNIFLRDGELLIVCTFSLTLISALGILYYM